MQDNQSGVEGLLTLKYHSHQDNNVIEASAAQLSAGSKNTVELLEFCQEKEINGEDYNKKEGMRYSIDADKLISLIKENGSKVK
jgi:hypothetical protein